MQHRPCALAKSSVCPPQASEVKLDYKKLVGLRQAVSSQRGIMRQGDNLTCRPRRRRSGARVRACGPLQVTACSGICSCRAAGHGHGHHSLHRQTDVIVP